MRQLPPLRIKSGQGNYAVAFYPSVPTTIGRVLQMPNAFIVADRNVARLYASALDRVIRRRPTLLVDANEDEKTLAGVAKVAGWLQANGGNRGSLLVAIGGGIIQDLCTFCAHVYYRGISWAYVPTTLLSMSDSCIGAKCGINLGAYKNQLGVFHSPSEVLLCTRFLETLPDSDIASGYGEILKLMLTGSRTGFQRLRAAVESRNLRNPLLADLIRDSLNVKKRVVEKDEYEKGLRRILNYGHTFGHALESATGHAVSHGLAVAWGMDLANFLSVRRGLLRWETFQAVHRFIAEHFSRPLPRRISAGLLVQHARRDKKASDKHLRLILMKRLGQLKIAVTPIDATLEAEVNEYLRDFNVFDRRVVRGIPAGNGPHPE